MDDKDEPKFTPGPWRKKGKRVFWTKPEPELPKDTLLNGLIAICASAEDDPEADEEARDNAKLIAAAPEMYALLIELRDNYVQNPNGIRRINKQLAKCRGEKYE